MFAYKYTVNFSHQDFVSSPRFKNIIGDGILILPVFQKLLNNWVFFQGYESILYSIYDYTKIYNQTFTSIFQVKREEYNIR